MKPLLECVLGMHIDIFFAKNVNDGTHSQCSGTYKDDSLWVPGTHEQVNNFESLPMMLWHMQKYVVIMWIEFRWK